MTTTPASSRFWFGFFAGIVTAVILAGILAVLFHHPPFLQHGTAALIRIHSDPPKFIFDDEAKRLDAEGYRLKVNTQIAIMRSPAVIETTLEDAKVADLPIIKKQKDAQQFLLQHLQIEPVRHSEIIAVSMPRILDSEAAVIINALVSAYFASQSLDEQENSNALIRQLNAELQRQTSLAHFYQDAISSKEKKDKEAGGVGHEQQIREMQLARTKLESLKAEQTGIEKLLSEAAKKGEQTGEIEKSLNGVKTKIENQTRVVKDSEVAVASIAADIARATADISFDQAHLIRVNKVTDAITQRLFQLQAERYRPNPVQLIRLAVAKQ